jgi:hypothetical protein
MLNKLFKMFGRNISQQIIETNCTGVQIGNGSITVNGISYSGKNITIRNGNVQIDGKNVTPKDEKVISITVEGNINNLRVDECQSCTITGAVKSVNTGSGDVEINGNCEGSIDTGYGDVEITGNCAGDIDTGSGNVVVEGYCAGDIDTGSGNVKVGAKLENNNISDNSSITIRHK